MGQLMQGDSSHLLQKNVQSTNVHQRFVYQSLSIAPELKVPAFAKIFQYQNEEKYQASFQFFAKIVIRLQLSKSKPKKQPFCYLNLAKDFVYGYKYKKNDKIEKIRPDKIFFRKKLFAKMPSSQKTKYKQMVKSNRKNRLKSKSQTSSEKLKIENEKQKVQKRNGKQLMIRRFAEIKLMSLLQIGPRLGRMSDGSDGILTDSYITFYSEVGIQTPSLKKQINEKEKVHENLLKKNFKLNEKPQQIQIMYSVFQKSYLIRQYKFSEKEILEEEQKIHENRSIKFFARQLEDQINKCILKLDNNTNQMSSIDNHLFQRDIDKAIQKFEESLVVLDEVQRINQAQQMSKIIGKYGYYKSYEKDLESFISESRSQLAESKNISMRKRSEEDSISSQYSSRFTNNLQNSSTSTQNAKTPTSPSSIRSFRFSSDSKFLSTQKKEELKTEVELFDNMKGLSNNIIDSEIQNQENWKSYLPKLKVYILDNKKQKVGVILQKIKGLKSGNSLQVDIFYNKMLMENAKSRHAQINLQKMMLFYMNRSTENDYFCSQIMRILALIHYHKQRYSTSINYFEKALNLQYKLKDYSKNTLVVLNNIGCLNFLMGNYENSILYFHRGFRLGQYCPDYELLMRCNLAMSLAQKGLLKQAKSQMYKTYKAIEPFTNMEIVCKFYSNLGYLDLCDGVLDKAKVNFESACQIEQKCLIPNGYKNSVILHTNYAMYHHKKGEWRKAASHFEKILSDLEELKGLQAVKIHFNIGKVYKELYNHDTAVKHFCQSRHLLNRIVNKNTNIYKEKIDAEIDKIEALRIDQVSEESSYAKMSRISKISRSYISNKPIQVK